MSVQSLCRGWMNEQERYYYFKRRHQEIKPCGRLCEWREEVRVTVYVCVRVCQVPFFFLSYMHMSICMCLNVCMYAGVCPPCVCHYMKWERRNETKTGDWEVDQSRKGKEIHVCVLTHLRESLCDFARMCASLWSQKKRDLYFRAYTLFSRTHTSTGLNISIMNCDYTLVGREREEFHLFLYFTKHTHAQQSTNQCALFMEEDNSLTITGIPLWLNSSCWCP